MKNIYKALADFQQEVPVILKEVDGYGYKYSDLPAIFQIINPLMNKHGLGFYQAINGARIKTVVFHSETGETIESDTDIPFESLVYEEVRTVKGGKEEVKNVLKGFEGMNRAQAIGALITYFRRYSIASILGLVTDKDTDGTSQKSEVKSTGNKAMDNFNQDLDNSMGL